MGLTLTVIRCFLWFERLALEALGKRLPSDYIAYDDIEHQTNLNPLMVVNDDTGTDESTMSIMRCSPSRWIKNSVALVVAIPLICAYGILHILWSEESEVFWTAWIYEWIMIPIMISIYFGAPLHAALGYFNPHSTTQQCHERLSLLLQDSTTQILVRIVAVAIVVYATSDCLFFIPLFLNMQTALLIPLYLIAVLLNIFFIYSGLFISLLSFRAINIRLQQVHIEVVQAVHSADPHNVRTNSTTTTTTYSSLSLDVHPRQGGPLNSSSGNNNNGPQQDNHNNNNNNNNGQRQHYYKTSAGGWLEEYQALWHDMHEISILAGPKIILGVVMFVVETSNMIVTMWKELPEDFISERNFILMLAMYVPNCTVLITTIFQVAYPLTLCEHYISSQLAILSMNLQQRRRRRRGGDNDNGDDDDDDEPSNSSYFLGELSQAFRRNPIRLHVGNFEMITEYSNFVTVWFASLFLVVVIGWEGVEA